MMANCGLTTLCIPTAGVALAAMWRLVSVALVLAILVSLLVRMDIIPEGNSVRDKRQTFGRHSDTVTIDAAVSFELPEPPPALAPNTVLQRARRLSGLLAPEGFAEVAVPGGDGTFVFMSLQDGRIARLHVRANDGNGDGDSMPSMVDVTYIARTGKQRSASCDNYTYATEAACGRPLGLLWHETGLIVAESYRGLLRVSPTQALAPVPQSILVYEPESLVEEFEGRPFKFANAVAASGPNSDTM